MIRQPTLHLLLQCLAAWMVVQLLVRFGGLVTTGLVVALAAVVATTIYGLRFSRDHVARYYAIRGCKTFIDLVCRLSRQQPPVESVFAKSSGVLRLKTPEDFAWCADELKSAVFGHDPAIDRMLAQLHKNAMLRQCSESQGALPPLGSFLLVGPRGIGKRTLASLAGQQLFQSPACSVLDMRDYSDGDAAVARLLGTRGNEGTLAGPVKVQPAHTIVLENIELAADKVQDLLQQILTQGSCADGSQGGLVSFRNCLLVMTTTGLSTAVQRESSQQEPMDDEQLVALLGTHTRCQLSLIQSAHERLWMSSPDPADRARAIVQMMSQECRRYQLQLEYVEPEIIVRELQRYSDTCGFEPCQIHVARLLRDPIHLATTHGLGNLVLTEDLVAPQTGNPPPSVPLALTTAGRP